MANREKGQLPNAEARDLFCSPSRPVRFPFMPPAVTGNAFAQMKAKERLASGNEQQTASITTSNDKSSVPGEISDKSSATPTVVHDIQQSDAEHDHDKMVNVPITKLPQVHSETTPQQDPGDRPSKFPASAKAVDMDARNSHTHEQPEATTPQRSQKKSKFAMLKKKLSMNNMAKESRESASAPLSSCVERVDESISGASHAAGNSNCPPTHQVGEAVLYTPMPKRSGVGSMSAPPTQTAFSSMKSSSLDGPRQSVDPESSSSATETQKYTSLNDITQSSHQELSDSLSAHEAQQIYSSTPETTIITARPQPPTNGSNDQVRHGSPNTHKPAEVKPSAQINHGHRVHHAHFSGSTTYGGYVPPPPNSGYQNTMRLDQQLAIATESLHHHLGSAADRVIKVFGDTNNWTMDSIMRQVDSMADVARLLNSRAVGQAEVTRDVQYMLKDLRGEMHAIRQEQHQMEERLKTNFQKELKQFRDELLIKLSSTTAGNCKTESSKPIQPASPETAAWTSAAGGRTPRGKKNHRGKNNDSIGENTRVVEKEQNDGLFEPGQPQAERNSKIRSRSVPPSITAQRQAAKEQVVSNSAGLLSTPTAREEHVNGSMPSSAASSINELTARRTFASVDLATGSPTAKTSHLVNVYSESSHTPLKENLARDQIDEKKDQQVVSSGANHDKVFVTSIHSSRQGVWNFRKRAEKAPHHARKSSNVDDNIGSSKETRKKQKDSSLAKESKKLAVDSCTAHHVNESAAGQNDPGNGIDSSTASTSSAIPPIPSTLPNASMLPKKPVAAATTTSSNQQPAYSPSYVHPALRTAQQRQEMRQRTRERAPYQPPVFVDYRLPPGCDTNYYYRQSHWFPAPGPGPVLSSSMYSSMFPDHRLRTQYEHCQGAGSYSSCPPDLCSPTARGGFDYVSPSAASSAYGHVYANWQQEEFGEGANPGGQ